MTTSSNTTYAEQYWPRVEESGTTPEMSQWKPAGAHASLRHSQCKEIHSFTKHEINQKTGNTCSYSLFFFSHYLTGWSKDPVHSFTQSFAITCSVCVCLSCSVLHQARLSSVLLIIAIDVGSVWVVVWVKTTTKWGCVGRKRKKKNLPARKAVLLFWITLRSVWRE